MTDTALRIRVAHVVRHARPDSLEIGSTKTGIIKCYGDASRPEVFMKRIENMITLRERAARAMQSPQDPVGE